MNSHNTTAELAALRELRRRVAAYRKAKGQQLDSNGIAPYSVVTAARAAMFEALDRVPGPAVSTATPEPFAWSQ